MVESRARLATPSRRLPDRSLIGRRAEGDPMSESVYLHGVEPAEQDRLARLDYEGALAAFRTWGKRCDAALWYAVPCAEGVRTR